MAWSIIGRDLFPRNYYRVLWQKPMKSSATRQTQDAPERCMLDSFAHFHFACSTLQHHAVCPRRFSFGLLYIGPRSFIFVVSFASFKNPIGDKGDNSSLLNHCTHHDCCHNRASVVEHQQHSDWCRRVEADRHGTGPRSLVQVL